MYKHFSAILRPTIMSESCLCSQNTIVKTQLHGSEEWSPVLHCSPEMNVFASNTSLHYYQTSASWVLVTIHLCPTEENFGLLLKMQLSIIWSDCTTSPAVLDNDVKKLSEVQLLFLRRSILHWVQEQAEKAQGIFIRWNARCWLVPIEIIWLRTVALLNSLSHMGI